MRFFGFLPSFLYTVVIIIIIRAKDNDLSVWLSVLPNERDNFDLTPQEFRDALRLAIHYHKPLLAFCDGCGAPSTLDHFLTNSAAT